ncbi:hypothetical protein D3C76_1643730 [compost metagenome]
MTYKGTRIISDVRREHFSQSCNGSLIGITNLFQDGLGNERPLFLGTIKHLEGDSQSFFFQTKTEYPLESPLRYNVIVFQQH